MRVFLAIALETQAHQKATALLETVRMGLGPQSKCFRWVKPENLHITLKFLGSVEEQKLQAIKDDMHQLVTQHRPFSLRLQGLDAFPNLKKPRVLYIPVLEPRMPILKLYRDIEAIINHHGFESDSKGYTPHLTLARSIESRDRDKICTLDHTQMNLQDTFVSGFSEIILFQSITYAEGPVYEPLDQFKLAPAF